MEKGYNLFLSNALKHGWSIPKGGIIMWSGTLATIPGGWALCDGANGTPDLREKFIVGAPASVDPGGTIGENLKSLVAANIPSHLHSIAHNHVLVYSSYVNLAHIHNTNGHINVGNDAVIQLGDDAGPGPLSVPSGGASVSMNHRHSVDLPNYSGNSGSQGSGTGFDNRPLAYKLAYIMKT